MYKRLNSGDIVRVKSKEHIKKEFVGEQGGYVGPCEVMFVREMFYYCGSEVLIVDVTSSNRYRINGSSYTWTPDMFEDMEIKGEGRFVSIWR